MPIPLVTIVQGTQQPAAEGVNRPLRAVLRFPDQSVRAGYVKPMAPACVAAEAFCALLLRGWGLNVPEPAIVADPFAFVSIDAGYPVNAGQEPRLFAGQAADLIHGCFG